MKKILLILMISISLIGYGKEINKRQLQNRNGMFYEINQQIPYTGKKNYYYKSGQIQIKAKFKDGKIENVISYTKSGSIRVNINYRDEKIENIISHYKSNPILGKEKFKDGQIEYEINFKDGKIVSLFK